jgi:hypothetical protein
MRSAGMAVPFVDSILEQRQSRDLPPIGGHRLASCSAINRETRALADAIVSALTAPGAKFACDANSVVAGAITRHPVVGQGSRGLKRLCRSRRGLLYRQVQDHIRLGDK